MFIIRGDIYFPLNSRRYTIYYNGIDPPAVYT